MKSKGLRLLFLVLGLLLTIGPATPPAFADACPTLQCATIINACHSLCPYFMFYRPVGECTAADGSTKTLWVAGCQCYGGYCVNG